MNFEDIISDKVKSLELSPIRKFFNLVSNVPGAISLTIGQPDFKTPLNIKESGKKAIDEDYTTYTHTQGYIELRYEISKYLKNHYKLDYDPELEISLTIGASQAIDATLRTLINTGDEVLIPSPGYVAYGACTTLSGGVPVFVPTLYEDNFKLKADTLKKYITPKTKLLILSYPSNPTGATMDTNDLLEISKVIIENNLLVISDEIYSELTFKSKHISIASLNGMKERTILINGFSKTFSMTGWRLGYIASPSHILNHIVKVQQYNVSCAPSISQMAAIEALKNGDSDVKKMLEEYNHRRIYCFNRLKNMGLNCLEPTGAFYIFPDIKKFKLSSDEFCKKLLYESKVATVPGSAFGYAGEGYIRISYAYSSEILKLGLDRIENFIANNQNI